MMCWVISSELKWKWGGGGYIILSFVRADPLKNCIDGHFHEFYYSNHSLRSTKHRTVTLLQTTHLEVEHPVRYPGFHTEQLFRLNLKIVAAQNVQRKLLLRDLMCRKKKHWLFNYL